MSKTISISEKLKLKLIELSAKESLKQKRRVSINEILEVKFGLK